jgi:His/Glu/Gln/Arg/opine family amino acid ABC transporter permease subunit
MEYDWNFRLFFPFWTALVRGAGVTLELGLVSSVIGTVIGFFLGMLLRLPIVGPPLRLFNDTLRAIPILVLMFVFYYFPYLEVLHVRSPSPFWSACLALTFAQANFTGEIVRSAIDGVSQKVIDGGRSIGLKSSTIWIYFVVPDVLRQILPTLMAFLIGNIKLSSLASVIGCEEVVYNARLAVAFTYHTLEAWIIVAFVYVLLVLPLTFAARKLEGASWLQRR